MSSVREQSVVTPTGSSQTSKEADDLTLADHAAKSLKPHSLFSDGKPQRKPISD